MTRRRPIRNLDSGAGWRRRRADAPRTAHAKVRESAAFVLERTLESRAPASTFLDGALERCDPRDHGLLRELVLGTLRWLRFIDHALASASGRPFARIQRSLLAPLRIGVYQLFFLDRVPAHAAVNEAVDQAASRTHAGGASFVNGVLRRIARSPRRDAWPVEEDDRAARLGVLHSHPDLLVERWLRAYGERRTIAILAANNRPKPMHLLAFRDRGGRAPLAEQLIDDDGRRRAVGPGAALPHGPVGQPALLGGLPARRLLRAGRGESVGGDRAAARARGSGARRRRGPGRQDVRVARGAAGRLLRGQRRGARAPADDAAQRRAPRPCAAPLRRRRRRPPLRRPLRPGRGRPAVQRPPAPCASTPNSSGGSARRRSSGWRSRPCRSFAARPTACGPGGCWSSSPVRSNRRRTRTSSRPSWSRGSDFGPRDLSADLRRPAADHVEAPGLWRLLPGEGHDGFTVQVLRRSPG